MIDLFFFQYSAPAGNGSHERPVYLTHFTYLFRDIKGVGFNIVNYPNNFPEMFSPADNVKLDDSSAHAFALECRDSKTCLPYGIRHFLEMFRADDSNNDVAKGQPAFDTDANHIPAGKTKGIEYGQYRYFLDLGYNRGYDPQPDYYLAKAEPEGHPCPSLNNADGSQSAQADITYAGQENEDAGSEDRRIEIQVHCIFLF